LTTKLIVDSFAQYHLIKDTTNMQQDIDSKGQQLGGYKKIYRHKGIYRWKRNRASNPTQPLKNRKSVCSQQNHQKYNQLKKCGDRTQRWNTYTLQCLHCLHNKKSYVNNWQHQSLLFYQHAHVANPQENCEDTKTKITRSKRLHSQNNLFPYIHLNHRQSIFCPSERDS